MSVCISVSLSYWTGLKKGVDLMNVSSDLCLLTHWSRVTHICVVKLTIIGSDNGLSPGRCQSIIWTNAGILLIEHLGTNFSENLITIHTFSFKKMHLNMSSGKWRPFCLGLNELIIPVAMKIMWIFDPPICPAHDWYHSQLVYIIHYNDVTMTTMASQITSLTVVHSIDYSA